MSSVERSRFDAAQVAAHELRITERSARLHGGELRVESGSSGRATRFVVSLPAQAP